MDPSSLAGALSSLKSARDIARAMLDLKVSSDVQLKVIELQELILSAQSNALEAQQKISDLEKRIIEVDQWESEKQRYALRDLGKGKYVYALRDEVNDDEPTHYICSQCFQEKEKAILQRSDWKTYYALQCSRCNNEIHVTKRGGPSQEIVWAI